MANYCNVANSQLRERIKAFSKTERTRNILIDRIINSKTYYELAQSYIPDYEQYSERQLRKIIDVQIRRVVDNFAKTMGES